MCEEGGRSGAQAKRARRRASALQGGLSTRGMSSRTGGAAVAVRAVTRAGLVEQARARESKQSGRRGAVVEEGERPGQSAAGRARR